MGKARKERPFSPARRDAAGALGLQAKEPKPSGVLQAGYRVKKANPVTDTGVLPHAGIVDLTLPPRSPQTAGRPTRTNRSDSDRQRPPARSAGPRRDCGSAPNRCAVCGAAPYADASWKGAWCSTARNRSKQRNRRLRRHRRGRIQPDERRSSDAVDHDRRPALDIPPRAGDSRFDYRSRASR